MRWLNERRAALLMAALFVGGGMLTALWGGFGAHAQHGPRPVGSTTCIGCHADEGSVVAESAHAQAPFARLWETVAGQPITQWPLDWESLCASCHATARLTERPTYAPAYAIGFACERCHGPGSEHASTQGGGDAPPGQYTPDGGSCETCHYVTPHTPTVHQSPGLDALAAGDGMTCTSCHDAHHQGVNTG